MQVLYIAVCLPACHSACVSCTGAGSDLCLECKPGYRRNDLNHCVGSCHSALFLQLQLLCPIVPVPVKQTFGVFTFHHLLTPGQLTLEPCSINP